MPVQQIIKDRYLDAKSLESLLVRKFGVGTYALLYKSNRWIITAPAALSEAEIDFVQVSSAPPPALRVGQIAGQTGSTGYNYSEQSPYSYNGQNGRPQAGQNGYNYKV